MSTPGSERPPRRSGKSKLSPERERELYTAVLDLLREVGYEALTMDAVAARSRSSKATLYRQWGSKSQLVVSAIEVCAASPPPMAELGRTDLTDDLRALARWAGRDAAKDVPLLRALGLAMQSDPELSRAMRETIVEPELDAFRALLQAAVERGEISGLPPAARFVPQLIFGALLSRTLIEGREPDEEYVLELVDEVVLPMFGITPSPPAGSGSAAERTPTPGEEAVAPKT